MSIIVLSELGGKISLQSNSYVDRTVFFLNDISNWKIAYLFEVRIHSGGKNRYCEL